MKKTKTGKEQIDEPYQPGNIGSMSGPIPSIRKGKKRTVEPKKD